VLLFTWWIDNILFVFDIFFSYYLFSMPFHISIRPISFPIVIFIKIFAIPLNDVIQKYTFKVATISIEEITFSILFAKAKLSFINIISNYLFTYSIR